MNNLIEKIFENFSVDDVTIPVEFLNYIGSSETYITWQGTGDDPALVADDSVLSSIYSLDIDIYSKKNYLKIMKVIKIIMVDNGFIWTGDSPDMYERDTGFYHKTVSFEKENIINL